MCMLLGNFFAELNRLIISFAPDLFITVIGSFLGFLGALLIYRFQIKNSEKNKDKERLTDIIYRFKYFNLAISNVTKSCKTQIKNYEELADNIKKKPHEIHLVKLIAFNDFQRISQMDSQEIFKAFIHLFGENDSSVRQYHSIYKSLDFIELSLNQQISSLEKNHQYLHNDQTRVKDMINGLSDDIASALFQLAKENDKRDYSNDPFVQMLEEKLNKFKELAIKKASLYEFETDFSKPLREVLIKCFREHIPTDFLVDKSRKAAVLLEHIKFNSLEFAKQIEKIYGDQIKAVQELEEVNNEIDRRIRSYTR